jgi:DNA-binding response OmpR family regulator
MEGNELLHARAPDGVTRQSPTYPPRRILVVDDDSDLRLLYTDVLTRPGCQVDAVEDGAAGWEALRANRYDLLIIDNDLPKLTGIELVKKLRSARMALTVVMATGRLPSCELARSPSLQLSAMLLKPFAVDELLDTVKGVLCAAGRLREQLEPLPNQRSQTGRCRRYWPKTTVRTIAPRRDTLERKHWKKVWRSMVKD